MAHQQIHLPCHGHPFLLGPPMSSPSSQGRIVYTMNGKIDGDNSTLADLAANKRYINTNLETCHDPHDPQHSTISIKSQYREQMMRISSEICIQDRRQARRL